MVNLYSKVQHIAVQPLLDKLKNTSATTTLLLFCVIGIRSPYSGSVVSYLVFLRPPGGLLLKETLKVGGHFMHIGSPSVTRL